MQAMYSYVKGFIYLFFVLTLQFFFLPLTTSFNVVPRPLNKQQLRLNIPVSPSPAAKTISLCIRLPLYLPMPTTTIKT